MQVSPSLLTQVLVRPFGSYRTQCFFPEGGQYATIDEIKTQLASRLGLPVSSVVHFGLCKESGEHVELDMSIADILASREPSGGYDRFPLVLSMVPMMCGGKGGFGSMLRAQGGRMASKRPTNNDSCRDLSGRRVKTVNDAKALANYIEKEPERLRQQSEKIAKKIQDGLREPTKRKIRFDNNEFENEHDDAIDLVSNAVEQGLKHTRPSLKVRAVPTGAAKKKRLAMWDDVSDNQEEEDSEENSESELAATVPQASSSSMSPSDIGQSPAKLKITKGSSPKVQRQNNSKASTTLTASQKRKGKHPA
ncbi:hypothetical protein BASA50_010327 [Batrachochytrium salamandrivorans]|uniref:SDE2-like domain-containing protein n=1 Tax=Batrachochytrium salamandrivorans TaxID=1357716 RepID=A0ABQ8F0M9_9FUNG|nr:hypothetical protein BASA62_009494 [Batrachochytrium salamandrivorans]KAH6588476.1 hypothetical protein BASA50_010702 [Batrachochytrium salamandrivorans]KAH6589011.1 hypothetical protein BASA50_010327 [Batrachochytrium salamandrivorans]KAH6592585.1 hypothetical protein BASA61_004521 [Batrachochytrium salamandrivorans]